VKGDTGCHSLAEGTQKRSPITFFRAHMLDKGQMCSTAHHGMAMCKPVLW
jgi:hypothetical protein